MQEVLAASRTQNPSCSSKQDAKQLGSIARFHSTPPHTHSFLQLGKFSKTWVKHTHNLTSLKHQWCNYSSER